MKSQRLDVNLVLKGDVVHCVNCGAIVGSETAWLDHALLAEGPAEELGSPVQTAPQLFVDAPIIFRQACCQGCLTALLTEVVAQADHTLRTKRIGAARTTQHS